MDRALILAHGKALVLIAMMLERCGGVSVAEFGDLLAVLAVTVAEAAPDEGDVLGAWAGIVREFGGEDSVG